MPRRPDRSSPTPPPEDRVSIGLTESATDTSEPPGMEKRFHEMGREIDAGAAREASELGKAAEAMRLEATGTGLRGERVLIGHVLGTHLLVPAEGFHGPRQTPAVIYLFADALAVRPSDDAPMSRIPLLGLRWLFPPLVIAHWLYKAGRIAHANVDLEVATREFEAAIADWTVDDFAEADSKLQVHPLSSLSGPVHVYSRLGFAHLWVPVSGAHPVRLTSTLPAPAEAFTSLWNLFGAVRWPAGITKEPPSDAKATQIARN